VEGEDPDTIVCGAVVTFFFSVTRTPTDPAKANTMVCVKKVIEPDTPSSIKKKAAFDATRPKRIVHAPHFWGDQREECWWIVIGMSGWGGGEEARRVNRRRKGANEHLKKKATCARQARQEDSRASTKLGHWRGTHPWRVRLNSWPQPRRETTHL
jgi:hypothetical protein